MTAFRALLTSQDQMQGIVYSHNGEMLFQQHLGADGRRLWQELPTFFTGFELVLQVDAEHIQAVRCTVCSHFTTLLNASLLELGDLYVNKFHHEWLFQCRLLYFI